MVKCKICGKEFKRITGTHLKKHNTTVREYIDKYGKNDLFDEYLRRYYDTASKKSFIRRFGEKEGLTKYEEYVKFHSYKNSFEYKHNKYGWTREQYDNYNKQRGITKQLCIIRHGKTKGLKIWDGYVKKQRIAGCVKQYFIDKYGEKKGTKKYEEINKKKSHMPFNNNSSKLATEFIYKLYESIKPLRIPDIYFNGKDRKEFWQHDNKNSRYYFYDFTIPSLRINIEFNGDYWHCNPKFYDKGFIFRESKTAQDKWDYDKEKLSFLEKKGFTNIIVWESDYKNNKEFIIKNVANEIRKRV